MFTVGRQPESVADAGVRHTDGARARTHRARTARKARARMPHTAAHLGGGRVLRLFGRLPRERERERERGRERGRERVATQLGARRNAGCYYAGTLTRTVEERQRMDFQSA